MVFPVKINYNEHSFLNKRKNKMEEVSNQINEKTTKTVAGCLRSILLTCINIVFSILICIKISVNGGSIVNGVFYGFVFFIIALILTFIIANKTKNLTILDCILPLVIGSISAVVFIPISILGLSFFSSITCLAASLFLTIVLFMYRAGKISGNWLIFPFLVFLYEILPIEFPTDIDNILCFGGNITNVVCALMFGKTIQNSIPQKNTEENKLNENN